MENYKSLETIKAMKVSEKLSKNSSLKVSQHTAIKMQAQPTFELWDAGQAPMSPTVTDYVEKIFDSAVNRYESSERKRLLENTPEFKLWEGRDAPLSPTVEEYIDQIYECAIDQIEESERLRERKQFRLWEEGQAPIVEEFVERIYSSCLKQRASSELRRHKLEEKLWAEAAVPALVDDYLSEVYLRVLSR